MSLIAYLISVTIFFIAALLQASFVPSFSVAGAVPDFIFVIFFILIFFESRHQYQDGFFLALMAGFFTDVFSQAYFGISMVALAVVYVVEKSVIRFLREGRDSHPIFYFIPLFFLGFFTNQAALSMLFYLFRFPSVIGALTVAGAVYSSIIALAGFYIYRKFIMGEKDENQLKLL